MGELIGQGFGDQILSEVLAGTAAGAGAQGGLNRLQVLAALIDGIDNVLVGYTFAKTDIH